MATENLAPEISLEDYARYELQQLNDALGKNGVSVIFSMVFGSAIAPREQSESVKVNPKRWDVDVLIVIKDASSLREVDRILTESRKNYIPASPSKNEWQEQEAMGVKPKRGLHVFMYTLKDLVEDTDPFISKIFKDSLLLSGVIPEGVLSMLGTPRQSAEIQWQNLQHTYIKDRMLI